MRIGIGIPTLVPQENPGLLVEWARRADAAGFSSLSVLDRVVYPNPDPLVTLAVLAGVTTRIRLLTSVLLAPLRPAGLLAKEAATLDLLSGGRLTLGLGVGNREDDFTATPATFRNRGAHFEEQLATMKRIWAGGPAVDGAGPVGPAPARAGGPELLIGGRAPVALRRSARWGDGYVIGSVSNPEAARQTYEVVAEEWKALGRAGRPRFVGGLACAIGEEAARITMEEVQRYYAYQGGPPGNAPGRPGPAAAAGARLLPHTPAAIREQLAACEAAGVDEVLLRPGVFDPEQVDRLAAAVL
jgi:alkanesulfonate monooxygenase SsuD/methylene tetrahydromethanopterin reductase-like flavin-dependent oxidoreductase (luciferase family)